MKGYLYLLRLLTTIGCLLLAQALFAQDSLDLLVKLDKGLPPSGLNGSGLGENVAYIGDVNNDGYDDWAVGLPYAADYENGESHGKVYIYYGGNSMQNNKIPDLILSGNDSIHNFGYNVSLAGDVNNDGYSDILIRSSQYDELYFGGNPMNSTPDKIFKDGYAATGAGDVNKDGYDDIVFSTSTNVQLFLGRQTMKAQPDIILKKGDVSNAGDVNKDGFDDVVVGNSSFYLNGYQTGRAYVYYGGATMDTIPDMVMAGEHADDYFGSTVSGVGDINNDGYADILVGASQYKNIDKGSGRTYIYFGGSASDTIADVLIDGGDGRFGQSAGDINKDGFNDLIVNQSVYWGGNPMDNIADYQFTSYLQLTGSGDYNNDGYADIITGQPQDNTYGDGTGLVSLYYGGDQLHSSADVTFYGELAEDYFGGSVSGVGDLNKDGFDDFIIGSYRNDKAFANAGCVDVFLGGNSISHQPVLTLTGQKENDYFGDCVSGAGDVNNDGYADFLTGRLSSSKANLYLGNEDMENLVSYTFEGGKSGRGFGNCLSGAGDFNRDGFDDYIIADPSHSQGTGRVYLYYGGSIIDTQPDLTFEGEAEFNSFGSSVSSAGDMNNDGFDDIMIGAPRYDRYDLLGRIYIYFGGINKDTIPDVVITGDKHYRQLGSIIGDAGDVNNDGYDDIIVGLPYTGVAPNVLSYANIYYGGSVIDTIPDVKIEKMDFGFGLGVSTAGDLNNDGYDDVVVGGAGQLFVYYGGQVMDTIPDMVIKGEGFLWGDFGSHLSFAGDVNNDNRTDILVGHPSSNAIGTRMGRAFIYSSPFINTGIQEVNNNTQNKVYPNPFTSETTIQYSLQKPGRVMIKVFNTSGQEIETLVNASQPSGEYQIKWHPDNLPGGIYFCQIQSPWGTETKKMILKK